jgi:hypothetical protein
MFAWSQLDFSAIPVSISAVSLISRQTWQNVSSKRKLQRIQNVPEGKRHPKKETSCCFCLCPFCFWGEVSNSWILKMISAKTSWLGNRKKIAKCSMGTSTCRSAFLYGPASLSPAKRADRRRRPMTASSLPAGPWTHSHKAISPKRRDLRRDWEGAEQLFNQLAAFTLVLNIFLLSSTHLFGTWLGW